MGKIKIADMIERRDIGDNDLIIVEDDIDTKRSTIKLLKRAFSGDEYAPDSDKFYSSQRTSELVNGLSVNLSTLAKKSDLDSLQTQLDNITSGLTDPNSELAQARGTYASLRARLDGEILEREKKYIQYPKIEAQGSYFDFSSIDNAKINIRCVNITSNFTVRIKGTNRFPNRTTYPNGMVTIVDNGVKITFTNSSYTYSLSTDVLELGEYVLYHNATFSDNFVKEGVVLRLVHTDGSFSTVNTYCYANVTRFVVTKPVNAIQIIPSKSTITNNMWVQLSNIMISKDSTLNKFYPYLSETINCTAGSNLNVTREYSRVIIQKESTNPNDNNILYVSMTDTSFTGQVIRDRLEKLEAKVNSKNDYCGLIEDPGTYIYAYNNMYVDSTTQCTISNDTVKGRNGYPSVKINIIDYDPNDQPKFTLVLPNTTNFTTVQLISLQIYIDKTITERFGEDDGLKIMLSSDDPYTRSNPPANYIFYILNKDDFVQGWNTIKLKVSDFQTNGHPNLTRISMVNFSMFSDTFNVDKSFWINSIILDQRMTPTILFAFDHLYISKTSATAVNNRDFTYKFPKLYNINTDIPATIFCNDKQTLTNIEMEQLSTICNTYGWELGNYGCNPNADTMTLDDNPRQQYLCVKETRQWIVDNFIPTVNAYGAPFGNLRPVTEPILKNLGFKMAKDGSNKFCSFFSKKDFAIPMHLLANPPGEGSSRPNPYSSTVIKSKIDEIVNTGQCICIYTSNVTRYGDEISAKETEFEDVIRHIVKYKNAGQLQCLTFSDFYDKCTS